MAAGGLASGVGARLHTRSAPLGAVLARGLVRCPACGRGPVICGGSMLSFHPQGGVNALEVCLVGQREGCPLCMAALWLRVAAQGSRCRVRVGVTPAGLHEGIERVFVAVVSAGQCLPVGCPLRRVGCGCRVFGLRVGSSWALWWPSPARSVPRCACVPIMRWGGEGGGLNATHGLRPVGGWWGEAGGMLGVGHRFARSRTRLASVRCLVASACPHVCRAGTLVLWLVRPSVRHLRLGSSPGGHVRRWQWRLCPPRGSPRYFRGFHRGLLALWLGGRCGRRGCAARRLRHLSGLALWHECRPRLASHVACQCPCAVSALR